MSRRETAGGAGGVPCDHAECPPVLPRTGNLESRRHSGRILFFPVPCLITPDRGGGFFPGLPPRADGEAPELVGRS